MLNQEEYLNQTRYALSNLFKIIDEFNATIRNKTPPVAIFSGNRGSIDSLYKEWEEDPSIVKKRNAAHKLQSDFDAKKFSYEVACGAVLQIAYQAIVLYGTPTELDNNYLTLLIGVKRINDKVKRFFNGREVRGVPLGLVIYAGRNQYNHLDESNKLNRLNTNIFERLSKENELKLTECQVEVFGSERVIRPIFKLNLQHTNYSSNIINALGWSSLRNYEDDLRQLITKV